MQLFFIKKRGIQMIFSEFLLKIVLFSSISIAYQHQPQEIQEDKYYRKYRRLFQCNRLSCHHHQTMIEDTADTAGFCCSDKKFCKVHILTCLYYSSFVPRMIRISALPISLGAVSTLALSKYFIRSLPAPSAFTWILV